MRVRVLLVSAAALALMGASAGDMAWAQHGHGGPGGPGGAIGGRGGSAPSVSAGAGARGGMSAAPSFHGQTTGAAPNVRANTFSGNTHAFSGNRFSRTNRGNFVNRGNNFVNRGNFARNNWGWRDNRFHRGFRGRRFFGGRWGWGDDYASDYCSYNRPWDWRWRQYCGVYSWGYGPSVTFGWW